MDERRRPSQGHLPHAPPAAAHLTRVRVRGYSNEVDEERRARLAGKQGDIEGWWHYWGGSLVRASRTTDVVAVLSLYTLARSLVLAPCVVRVHMLCSHLMRGTTKQTCCKTASLAPCDPVKNQSYWESTTRTASNLSAVMLWLLLLRFPVLLRRPKPASGPCVLGLPCSTYNLQRGACSCSRSHTTHGGTGDACKERSRRRCMRSQTQGAVGVGVGGGEGGCLTGSCQSAAARHDALLFQQSNKQAKPGNCVMYRTLAEHLLCPYPTKCHLDAGERATNFDLSRCLCKAGSERHFRTSAEWRRQSGGRI